MLTPQNPSTTVVPNAVYIPSLNVSLSISNQGQLVAKVQQMQFQGAAVDGTGKWSKIGPRASAPPFTFGFDASGNLTGLPANLVPAAPALAAAFAAIEAAAAEINAILKLV